MINFFILKNKKESRIIRDILTLFEGEEGEKERKKLDKKRN